MFQITRLLALNSVLHEVSLVPVHQVMVKTEVSLNKKNIYFQVEELAVVAAARGTPVEVVEMILVIVVTAVW